MKRRTPGSTILCTRRRVATFARVTLFAVALAPSARAEDPVEPSAPALDPRRYELAGFPIVGGNSDIGFQFGAAATWTRFYDTAHPYLWNIDLLLSASLKDDTAGFRMVQQSHVLRLDAPELFGGQARLDARGSFQRTINQGYYGIGNVTAALVPPGEPNIGRTYQYLQEEGRVRTIIRVHTRSLVDFAFGTNLRYEAPSAYDGTQLSMDLAAREPDGQPVLPGGSSMLLAGLAAGAMIDTRDSEFVTRSGVFYQVGVSGTVGSADEVGYGEAAAVLAHYAPLGNALVFANRFVASFQFGRVPFYDLAQGGVFEPQYMVGGEQGVRGVPLGRYAGRVKMISNTELRATPFPRFHILGQRLRIGLNALFDAGRVWSDYHVVSPADGTTLNLKYGVGGGVFLQWGEAAIFRVEVAYSPDAESENPGFPVGIYVSDGLMF
ncbi:MAG TPA: BamA/TamA family outer membrane protein [Polyangiaceae bacterium]